MEISDSSKILDNLPEGLRGPLFKSYRDITANFIEHKWEPSELNGGKFCEVVYAIINGVITGIFPKKLSKPKDVVSACRAIEIIPANPLRVGDRSLRILIPRIIPALYEIRNNRGVGHVGGDVDPNLLDATAVYGMASWILAELVRIFHDVSTEEAQEIVDFLVERKHPLIWEVGGVKRVLNPLMSSIDQTLVLLHQKPGWVAEKDLVKWVEYSNESMFRSRVIRPLHRARLIEYDPVKLKAHISPIGIEKVERSIIKTRS